MRIVSSLLGSSVLATLHESDRDVGILELSWNLSADREVRRFVVPSDNWITTPEEYFDPPDHGSQRIVFDLTNADSFRGASISYVTEYEDLRFNIGHINDSMRPYCLIVYCPVFLRCDVLAHEYHDDRSVNLTRIHVSERAQDDVDIAFPEGFWAPEFHVYLRDDVSVNGGSWSSGQHELLTRGYSNSVGGKLRYLDMYGKTKDIDRRDNKFRVDDKQVGYQWSVVDGEYVVVPYTESYLHTMAVNKELTDDSRMMDGKKSPLFVFDVNRKFEHFDYSLKGTFDYAAIRDELSEEPVITKGTVDYRKDHNSSWAEVELDTSRDDDVVSFDATVSSQDFQRIRFSSDYVFRKGSKIKVSLIANHSIETPCQWSIISGADGICTRYRPILRIIKSDVGQCEMYVKWADHIDDDSCTGPVDYVKPPLDGETGAVLDPADCYE